MRVITIRDTGTLSKRLGYVPPEVNPGATLLLVGEAPGADEDVAGKPFVGKSGAFLMNSLTKFAGTPRNRYNIINVYPFRPEGNDIAKADPTTLVEGKRELYEFIERAKPKAILAVGNTALEALTGLVDISKRRGSVYNYKDIPVLASLHPAAVLRDSSMQQLFGRDLMKWGRLVLYGPELPTPHEFTIRPTEDDLNELRAQLLYNTTHNVPVAVDIEADERQLACVGFGLPGGRCYCIPATTPEYRAAIREFLGYDYPKIFHNAVYDLAFLKHRCGIIVRGKVHDTLAMHQALAPELPRDLGTLTSLYTNQPYYKDMYTAWADGSKGSEAYDTYYTYNCLDVKCTYEIYKALQSRLGMAGLYDVYEVTRTVIPHAVDMSCLGIKYDQEEADRLGVKLNKELARWQKVLDGRAGRPINVFSPPQVKELLYRDLGLPMKRGKTGSGATTSEKALMSIYSTIPDRKIRKIIRAIIATRQRRKFISSYLGTKKSKGPASSDGRVRTSFSPAGTDTGRWSASKFLITEGLNLQTVPKKFKSCFIADEGMVLWMADYSQIEARFVAYLAGDKAQIAMFNTPGGDIHKLNAARIFNVAIEDVTPHQRQVAKSCVHALNYGVGPVTLMETVNKKAIETGFYLSLDMARRVRNVYMTEFRDVIKWQEAIWVELKRSRRLTNPFGRTRLFTGPLTGGESEHTRMTGLAFLPQSTVPDLMNRALITLRDTPPVPGFETALQIHDALGGWAPMESVDTWVPKIRAAMTIPVVFPMGTCTVPVEIAIGTRWSSLVPHV